jgi:hypothetical protein
MLTEFLNCWRSRHGYGHASKPAQEVYQSEIGTRPRDGILDLRHLRLGGDEKKGDPMHTDKREVQAWQPMTLSYVGQFADLVQGGGGKLSVDPGDPGEPQRCPPAGPNPC